MERERGEADPSLRRIQRDSAVIAIGTAVLTLAMQRGRPDGALGVLAGAALMAFSYRAIRGGVNAIVRKASTPGTTSPGAAAPKGRAVWAFVKFIGRYLVIGLAGWVVLVPLRAHPLGLFVGVSVPVLAIGLETIRLVRTTSRRRRGE
jgi:ABC-type polysaccharide/polyol phosphate export permease